MKFTKTFSLIGVFLIIASCKNGSKNGEHNMNETKLHEFSNDLVNETSPYLLQHAHNPVDWKPWSDKAFNNAITENRLIVLSIGYSTCHWCHVMEEESFEDVEVAKLMNEKFVSVKVDREERPDVDMVYQTALQLVNGTGGWPMNAILLPDGSPVYLGTYSAKEDWKAILNQFSAEFQKNPIKMKEYATMLANGVQEVYEQPVKQLATKVTATKISNGIEAWSASWDEEWGGNVGQQKFIIPTNLKMLLEYSTLQQEEKIKRFVFKTLNKVSQGGIYDHIGGGFFRYSTDARWKVPHFEKMLYDNAQMMSLLSKAYTINGSKEYRSMVDETFTFLKTEMRNEEGGYFSAMDADTNGEEGLYYVWKKKELQSIIGDDFELFSKFYEIKNSEVWENSSFVLFNTLTAAEFSEQAAISEAELYSKLATWKTKLYNARQLRQKPAKDYKIITSWNALLIDGLVDAYKSFADDKYLLEAISIFDYLKSNNYSDNRLVHSYTTDSKQKEVFLEDYALLAKGALSLYEVTLDVTYLDFAKELMTSAISKYKNESGLFYYNTSSALVPKIINTSDGVVPSANAIMGQNMFKLGHLEYNTDYLEHVALMGSLLVDEFERQPINYGTWGSLLLSQVYPFYEVAVVGDNAKALVTELGGFYLANTLVVGSTTSSDIALFKDRYSEEETFVYVCQNNTCKLPVKTAKEAYGQMKLFGYPGVE